ncbi:glycerol ABC transporter membrane protein [Mycoplasma testudineum]|uniref:Glycerol ABC transporter membrane protein n=1 Tax=Mycoplasma testudineum TaxID=244584 RepID=A0A4R6ICT8_9MOLU|nr:carbohydrate ABC transporter permease [Mycoplasma testudineum]OYD26620.1 glycerol transporter subunit C [Mycoplasma testudineum]TDO19456.1 glycerol ABC transporter membrane protein [Mycoplasma testudineum]
MFKYSKWTKEFSKILILVFVLVIVLFPLYFLLVTSLMSTDFLTRGKISLIPDAANFENYSSIVNQDFWEATSYSIATLVTVLSIRIVTYILAGYAMSKASKSLRTTVFIFFIIISLVPEFTIYLPLKQLLNSYNLLETSIVFSLTTTSFFSFFLLLYVYKAFKNIDKNKLDQSKIDNLRLRHKIWYVFLPNLKVPIFLIILFTTVQSWNEYLWPLYVLNGIDKQTISLWFKNLGQTGFSSLINIQAAGSVISLSITLVAYLVFSPWINRRISQIV